jgi:hypothetical protein
MLSIHRAVGWRLAYVGLALAACDPDAAAPAEPAGQVAQAIALTAAYDSTLKAPLCASVGSSCDTGPVLVRGRATIGPEPHDSNTIHGSCLDGLAGSYHLDESLDRLAISTLDGTDLAAGTTVRVDATAWIRSEFFDQLDLYYATDVSGAGGPVWSWLASLTAPATGLQTLSTTFTLLSSPLQAVRGQLRSGGSASPCTPSPWNDRDDLVFAALTSDDAPPTTAITSPAPGTTFSDPITLTAVASDDLGVTRVEFYRDDVLIGTATSAPYTVTWDPAGSPNGAHALTSKAFDTTSHATVSAPIAVQLLLSPTLPQIALGSPADQATIGGLVTVTADTLPGTYPIATVELSVGGVVIATDTSAPYTTTWDSTAAADGAYSFSGRACDVTGRCRTSTITAFVFNDREAPHTTLVSPADGATISRTIRVEASAFDFGGVTRVELYLDDAVRIGTSTFPPYAIDWNSATAPDGPHTLTARAHDWSGNVGTATIAITLQNLDTTPPAATLTAPAPGATLSGPAALQASASDDLAVVRVEFYLDGATLIGSATTAPYGATWDSTSAADGAHTISCRAYDGAGHTTDSAPVAVTIHTDLTPPTTSLTSPAAGSSVTGTVQIAATASDDLGVVRVEFYLDGTTRIATAQTAPFTAAWNTAQVALGPHLLSSKAYDAVGHSTISDPVTVTVVNPPPAVMATLDVATGSPRCLLVGRSCDTGTLIDGRGNSEPSTPNTLNHTCADGTTGRYHVDESLDRLKLSTVDGGGFAPGKTVRIEATVWAYSSFTSDALDIFTLVNAPGAQWVYRGTLTPTRAGAQTLSGTYVLPAGLDQSVRGQFRFGGSTEPCTSGAFNDRDDLTFSVQPSS